MKTNRAKLNSIREVDLPTFGSRIAELRRESGWSKRELSRRTGLRPERISRLERGIREASVTEVAALADVLGVSLEELVHGPAAGEDGRAPGAPAPAGPAGSAS